MPSPQEIFAELTKGLPTFPDGRIDYSEAVQAPVINVVCYCQGDILILKRSHKVSSYQGLWNGVSGFIDEPKTIAEFAQKEIREELSLEVSSINIAHPYQVHDVSINKIWFVYPALAVFHEKPEVRIDWEHEEFKWILPTDLKHYQCVKDFEVSVQKALALL